MSKTYTAKEVAKKLRISEGTVYELVKKGEIKKVEGLGRVIRIPSEELKNTYHREYFMYNSEKVEIVNASLGKIRKIKGLDKYVLVDIVKALGTGDTYTIARAIDNKYITKLTKDETREYGFFSNQYGILLVSADGIKKYRAITRNIALVDALLKGLGINTEAEQIKMTEVTSQQCENTNNGEVPANIKIFEGHNVEVFNWQGKILLNPYHVGECLDISAEGVRKAITRMNERQAIKLKNSDVTDSNIRKLNNAGENFLTESGVYKFIFKSHKENAEKFQDWVTDEVLPSINKTGGYVANTDKFVNSYFSSFSDEVKKAMIADLTKKNRVMILEMENNYKLIEEIKQS